MEADEDAAAAAVAGAADFAAEPAGPLDADFDHEDELDDEGGGGTTLAKGSEANMR